jgi:hypothetical protein
LLGITICQFIRIMKVVRAGAVLVIVAALGTASIIVIKQQLRIRTLKESRRSLAAQYQELSATNASLLSVDATRKDELTGLRQQTLEVLRLRNQLAQAHRQLAAAEARNQTSRAENPDEFAGYVTREQLRFAGFATPENAFQSFSWAEANRDYTNWLAALAPGLQEEELANPKSFEEFQHRSTGATGTMGMQVLATKPIGSDRVELKVRLDSENRVTVLIFPMVAIGNEWKLGDDIQSYTQAWDSPNGAQ